MKQNIVNGLKKINGGIQFKQHIVVTMPKGDRKHLQEKIDTIRNNGYAWWDFKRVPTKIALDSKIFVVCKNSIEGYFTIDRIFDGFIVDKYQNPSGSYLEETGYPDEDVLMRIYFLEWYPIKVIVKKGFQGFRYRDFDYQTV